MCGSTPSRMSSQDIRLTEYTLSWEYTSTYCFHESFPVTATLMKTMCHQVCMSIFMTGFCGISWEFTFRNGFCESLIFRESSLTGMDFVRVWYFVRVNLQEWISWEFGISWEFPRDSHSHENNVPPGLHVYFHDGFLWYFMRVHLQEWILWEFDISWEFTYRNGFCESLVFRESKSSGMDFVRVWHFMRVRLHEWISWEFAFTKTSYFVRV
jgi:hypothetical protein